MKRVGTTELKNNLSAILRQVEAGETFEVTRRGRPIALLVPIEAESRLILRQPTKAFSEIRDKVYPPVDLGFDPVELLLDDRRKR